MGFTSYALCWPWALPKLAMCLGERSVCPERRVLGRKGGIGAPGTGVGQSHGGRGETGLAFSAAALCRYTLAWRFLGVTKALEGNLHLLSCQQAITACPSLMPPPALAMSTFIRNLTVFFGWISPENPILRLPSDC